MIKLDKIVMIFGHRDRHAYRKNTMKKMKAEVDVTCLQAEECQGKPANHQKLRKGHGTDLSFVALRRNHPC